jgi:arginine/lysine/histidine/glutamine transport system substrate-binding and permease protein
VTIKAERKQTVDFTDPYFKADLSISVLDSEVSGTSGVDDLQGKTLGTQSGTTSEDCSKVLKQDGKVEEVRTYDTSVDAFNDLAAKRIDAVLIDLPTANQIVAEREGVTVVQKVVTNEDYGIAVSKENPNLREAINDALAEMRDDGSYDVIYRQWFDADPPA